MNKYYFIRCVLFLYILISLFCDMLLVCNRTKLERSILSPLPMHAVDVKTEGKLIFRLSLWNDLFDFIFTTLENGNILNNVTNLSAFYCLRMCIVGVGFYWISLMLKTPLICIERVEFAKIWISVFGVILRSRLWLGAIQILRDTGRIGLQLYGFVW